MNVRFAHLVGLAAAMATPLVAHAQLNSMSAQYFKVQNSSANHDFQGGIDGGIVTGLVNSTLGPDGLPTAHSPAYSGPSGPITQVNGSNELQWWTPNGTSIFADGTATVTVPFSTANFFANGETSNNNWFRTAIFSGTMTATAPTAYNFSLGSDDDSWLFIDGNLVGDNGGVKGGGPTTFSTGTLSTGNHSVELFFADRHQVASSVSFNPTFQVTSTPEPASLSLMATGLVGVFGAVRRKKKAA
jgi:fibro-slime domain-containing protein